MAVDPTGKDLKRFVSEDPGCPVVMLNLLRFAPNGRDSYEEYGRRIQPFLEKAGAEILYIGLGLLPLVAEADQSWDAVLLVRYPSRLAFSQMVADPEYQKITGFRTRALTDAVLQPTIEWKL